MLSKLLKRMLIITCCLLVGVGVVFVRWYVKGNLTDNSVYYAMHIEHSKGTHPDFAMVIDNMDTIKQPKVDKVVYRPDSGLSGAFSGRVYIYNEAYSVDGKTPELYMGHGDDDAYIYIDNRGISYEFDESFKLRRASDYDTHDEIDIHTVDEKAISDELYKYFGFLIKANDKKPRINLQWFFNKKYYKRFN
ncbi:MAG: hypothetical protein M3I20_08140 [Mogibacterium diversum]|uniref:hypothetical protein n=1 Tax=Mogibacterium diversum TaxID=114527 RepID=UPI0020555D9C|nr:hypothetical protein [Mogibacterium diversum]UQF81388.1 MAG: hypothetical protein M3I20_08140 [Mogibacterium diversum]